jgi:hypothetical protein
MKQLIILILLLSISNSCLANTNSIAIDAVKSHKEITRFLVDKPLTNYNVTYQEIELGNICGFIGCHWRKIVSVKVSSKTANSPTTTILALVKGTIPSRNIPTTVSFITLKNKLSNTLVFVD